jgi:hypothetical protein
MIPVRTLREQKQSRRPRPFVGTRGVPLTLRPVHPSITVIGEVSAKDEKLQVIRTYVHMDKSKTSIGKAIRRLVRTEVKFHIQVASVFVRGQ